MKTFIENEVKYLRQLGSRTTGSDSHKKLVKRVYSKLSELGYEVNRDSFSFKRWSINSEDEINLSIQNKNIPIAAAYPYSGTTQNASPDHFIEGKLCRISSKRIKSLKKLFTAESKRQNTNDLIGFYKVPNICIPAKFAFRYLEDYGKLLPKKVDGPLITSALAGCAKVLNNAKQAGFKAVVFIWYGELSTEHSLNQYIPFIEKYHDMPAVWLSADKEKLLVKAQREAVSGRLKLKASIEENCKTETIWAVSKGNQDSKYAKESIIVATHSDGVNSIEENGHIGLLELAKWATKHLHNRNIIFVFFTGHLRLADFASNHDQALSAWLNMHEQEWKGDEANTQKAVAGLVIEHLGAIEKPINGSSTKLESPPKRVDELVYVTTDELYSNIFKPNWSKQPDILTIAIRPIKFKFFSWLLRRKIPSVHFGEGQPLFKHNIPSIALVSGPSYLMTEFKGEQPILEDLHLMEEQIDNFKKILEKLDKSSKKEIGELN